MNTLFHEFGHALHGLFARVTYPKFAGTDVFRDFVEFPSQVNEMWMLWPEVLANYAVHNETGEPMPQEFVDKLHASEQFNEGFKTSEYLAAALLDQAWHAIGADASVTDVAAFEADALAAVGLDNPAVPTRYSSAVLRARLLRRIRRRVLLLHLERGARRRHRRVVQGERRPDARERRPFPVAAARRRRVEGPA